MNVLLLAARSRENHLRGYWCSGLAGGAVQISALRTHFSAGTQELKVKKENTLIT